MFVSTSFSFSQGDFRIRTGTNAYAKAFSCNRIERYQTGPKIRSRQDLNHIGERSLV